MTGGLPLLVDMLAIPFSSSSAQHNIENSEDNLAEAIRQYYELMDVMSYTWFYGELTNTTRAIKRGVPDLFQNHIDIMTRSLAHLPSEAYPQLYDHRFFHYDKSTGLLRCIK